MRKARSWTKEKSIVPERCKRKLKEEIINMVNTISACFYCELIKLNTPIGPRFSTDFHRLFTERLSFNTSRKQLFRRKYPFQNQLKRTESKNTEAQEPNYKCSSKKNKKLEFILNSYSKNIAGLGQTASFPQYLFYLVWQTTAMLPE